MSASQKSGTPNDNGNNSSSDISDRSGQARLIVEPIKTDIAEIKGDVKAIKDYRHTDQRYILTVYAAGFLLLAGMVLLLYSKLDDKISAINALSIKLDTKLEDLIERIPPVQTPPPRR